MLFNVSYISFTFNNLSYSNKRRKNESHLSLDESNFFSTEVCLSFSNLFDLYFLEDFSFMTAFGGTNPLKDIFITAGFLFILEVTHTVSCFLANKTCSNASREKAAKLLQKDFIHCILVIPNTILKGWAQQKHSE